MIPENILGRMRACKTMFSHVDTPAHEAAAARAMYDKLIAKYGDPDADTDGEALAGIPIWTPPFGWKAEVAYDVADNLFPAYDYIYRKRGIAIIAASEIPGRYKNGWLVATPLHPEAQHFSDAEMVEFACSLGFRKKSQRRAPADVSIPTSTIAAFRDHLNDKAVKL